jgi:hypothetical protein
VFLCASGVVGEQVGQLIGRHGWVQGAWLVDEVRVEVEVGLCMARSRSEERPEETLGCGEVEPVSVVSGCGVGASEFEGGPFAVEVGVLQSDEEPNLVALQLRAPSVWSGPAARKGHAVEELTLPDDQSYPLAPSRNRSIDHDRSTRSSSAQMLWISRPRTGPGSVPACKPSLRWVTPPGAQASVRSPNFGGICCLRWCKHEFDRF